jgi:RNA polymerase sigma factor (sigma-70 family)
MTQTDMLIEQAANRNAEAFAQIVTQYQRLVLATCRRRLTDPADVDDAVQETFLRLAQKASQVRSNLGGWLHVCAVNVSIDMNRRRGSRRRYELAAAEVTAAKIDAHEALRELREHIDLAMEKLDARQRELIIQRFFVGRSQSELAAEAGISPSTISHRLDRAIEKLRKYFNSMGCMGIGAATLVGLMEAEHASATMPAALTANIMKIGLSGVSGGGSGGSIGVMTTVAVLGIVATLAIALGMGIYLGWDAQPIAAKIAPPPSAAMPANMLALQPHALVPATTHPSKDSMAPGTHPVEDYLGKWTGKWDNTWTVEFTITQNRRTQQLSVLYVWEEEQGKPMWRMQRTGKVQGNMLKSGQSIDIILSEIDPNKAQAIGHFATQRTANLVRQKR